MAYAASEQSRTSEDHKLIHEPNQNFQFYQRFTGEQTRPEFNSQQSC